MNLQQTVQALEQNNIQIALDVGVHSGCSIDSNCPLAVELRKVINESDVTLEQLIEGFAASQEPPPEAVAYVLPEFDAKATIRIAGTNVELDFEEALRAQLGDTLDKKRRELNRLGGSITELGKSLYESYLNRIYALRDTRTLPQLEFDIGDLTKANCLTTSDGEYYHFLFPRTYNPEYVVTNGVRYKLADEDIKALIRDIYISYTISKEYKIIHTDILNSGGSKFRHYHGGGNDCWGNFQIPERWNGNLKSLSDLTTQVAGALRTINKDSLMTGHPRGMVDMDDLMERSTKLGVEGITEEREQPEGGWTTEEGAPRRWGQTRATGVRAPTVDEELRRRFGTEHPEDNEMICNLCGATLGHHYGRGETCPRDRR